MRSKNKKPKNQTGDSNHDTGEATAATGNNRFGKTVITDSRFSHAQSDPKFAGPGKDKEKVPIDGRFRHAFTDKRFAVSTAPIDKRGKKRKKRSAENDLKRHYRLEEDEEEEKADIEEERTVETSELELKEESDSSEEEEDSDEVEDEPSTDTTDEDEDEFYYSEEEDTFVQEEDVPTIDKETRRLAVVNLDWSNIKAVDLYVLLSSFLPKGGYIESVAVYPTEFGLQRMEEEAAKGPVGLFDDGKGSNDGDESEDGDGDDGEIDNKKLRAYELSRMKYYNAVVTCDSIATSDHLYTTCDGVEFERSSNKLDLRFIPDSMEFKHPPRDIAKEVPASYEGVDFHSRALQHSKIQITWDEDEPQRANMLKRKFNADQLADLEHNDVLASDKSDSDEDEDALENDTIKKPKKQDLYRAILQPGECSNEDDEEGCLDMEVTFNTDLENLSKRVLEKKDKQSETVWEAHLRKMKEKKKARRNRSKNSSDDERSELDGEPKKEIDDFFLETKYGARKKNDSKVRKDQEMEKEASRAELELLLADDNGGDPNLKGYNMKPKKVKGKKGKENLEERKLPSSELEDERFSRIFTSHLYALDPTDPQFKRSATYVRQLQRKGFGEDLGTGACKLDELPTYDLETSRDDQLGPRMSIDRAKHELSSLVKSIKMKSKQAEVTPLSKVKISRKK